MRKSISSRFEISFPISVTLGGQGDGTRLSPEAECAPIPWADASLWTREGRDGIPWLVSGRIYMAECGTGNAARNVFAGSSL